MIEAINFLNFLIMIVGFQMRLGVFRVLCYRHDLWISVNFFFLDSSFLWKDSRCLLTNTTLIFCFSVPVLSGSPPLFFTYTLLDSKDSSMACVQGKRSGTQKWVSHKQQQEREKTVNHYRGHGKETGRKYLHITFLIKNFIFRICIQRTFTTS